MNSFNAISPIDGRYSGKVDAIRPYFSEMALAKYRVLVEIEYLIFLSNMKEVPEVKKFSKEEVTSLRSIYLHFMERDFAAIKGIEEETNHDVKACEYFIKGMLKAMKFESVVEMVHFGLTSQDINNTATAMMLQESLALVTIPNLHELLQILQKFANELADVPMLSRTHGQSASPTTVGKEFAVFSKRLELQIEKLRTIEIYGKFSGATGNYHTHVVAYPEVNWPQHMQELMKHLRIKLNPVTTQIEPYDCIAEVCDAMRRINTILIDFSQDIWRYISDNYFKLKTKKGEIGSSTMPHKVNPIDFENAEGNFGVANAMFNHFSSKLPISRLQRDLTDSTVLRNLGVPFGHSLIGYTSLSKGLSKLEVNCECIAGYLEAHTEVLAEAIQTIMRKCGIEKPYEKVKELTRGKEISMEEIGKFIKALDIPKKEKEKLLKLTPGTYVGLAERLAKSA
jgi:adenylosuccinate lyase